MSAKHAVLGLVLEHPAHGYDLARRLRERFGSSGFAPTGVYSALDQLSAEGLVRASRPRAARSGERAAPRTVYEATDLGRERFDSWMRSTSSVAHVRDELNMKLALSRPRDLPGLVEQLRVQEEQCLRRLEALRRPDGDGQPARQQGATIAWPQVARLLVRDAEIRQLQARIEWLQRARTIVSRLPGVASAAPAAPAAELRESAASDRAGSARERAAGAGRPVAQGRVAQGRVAQGRVAQGRVA